MMDLRVTTPALAAQLTPRWRRWRPHVGDRDRRRRSVTRLRSVLSNRGLNLARVLLNLATGPLGSDTCPMLPRLLSSPSWCRRSAPIEDVRATPPSPLRSD